MGLVTLHRRFDFAAPRLHAERDGKSSPSAGSSLPRPGRAPLSSLSGTFSPGDARRSSRRLSQRVSRWFLASPSPAPEHCTADGDACSLADQERIRAALGRTVAAVQAAHHIGEGAPTTGARGNP